MKMLLRVLFISSLAAIPISAPAFDNGQYGDVDPETRAWFKSVKSPHGVPCCDMADGHQVQWDIKDGKYRVFIKNEWVSVPPEAVVTDYGNPTGNAVVWYVAQGPDAIYIRCFVPGGLL